MVNLLEWKNPTVPAGETSTNPTELASLGWDWRPVLDRLPPGGGTIHLAPGNYQKGFSWKKPGLCVIDGNGAKVREPFGGGGHKTQWSGIVLKNLAIGGTVEVPAAGEIATLPNCDFIRLEDVDIYLLKNNGMHFSNSKRTVVELERVEISKCGQGNAKHNIYVGRLPSIKVDALTSHSSKGSHAFKSIARNTEMENSWLGTVAPGVVPNPSDNYVSTTLADIVSCGRSRLSNVTLDHFQRDDTGNQVLDYRTRNSINSCDEPPYGTANLWDTQTMGPAPVGYEGPLEPVGNNNNLRNRYYVDIGREGEFWTEAFWQNPPWFDQVIENCYFVERGQTGRAIAIDMEGTAPEIVSRSFGPSLLLPKPQWWFERARLQMGSNVTFSTGFRQTVRV